MVRMWALSLIATDNPSASSNSLEGKGDLPFPAAQPGLGDGRITK